MSTFCRVQIRACLVTTGLCLALAISNTTARANSISIENASFDSPDLASASLQYTYWQPYENGGVVSSGNTVTNSDNLSLSGWDLRGGGYDVVDRRTATHALYDGQFMDFWTSNDQMASGSNLVYGRMTQTLSTQYAANTKYTLTVQVARNSSATCNYAGYEIGLATYDQFFAGVADTDTNVALQGDSTWESVKTTGASAASNGSWTQVSLSFTTPAAGGAVGKDIVVVIASGAKESGLNGGYATLFDAVKLDASPIPEPGTCLLLTSGIVGLLAYAWRKRR